MSRYPLTGKRIFVAGHGGMVGQALVRRLAREDCEVLTADRSVDLRDQAAVRSWFAYNAPDAVLLAASKVGGLFEAMDRMQSAEVPAALSPEDVAAEIADMRAQRRRASQGATRP